MAVAGLLCLCLLATLVDSYPLPDVSSSSEGLTPPPPTNGIPTENLKEHKTGTKHNAVVPRSNGGLFGLGIGGNLLGINAGAGISHGRGGWGEVGMNANAPGYVPYYETPYNPYY
uniref:Uncharacterized protein n=1 Tax=Cuerna arida TaxID=1464854 RepID=A0A1B6G152_9HEMI